jgi:hypothetical protein
MSVSVSKLSFLTTLRQKLTGTSVSPPELQPPSLATRHLFSDLTSPWQPSNKTVLPAVYHTILSIDGAAAKQTIIVYLLFVGIFIVSAVQFFNREQLHCKREKSTQVFGGGSATHQF